MLTDVELTRLTNEILSQTLADVAFDHAEISTGLDHQDEESIFVTAHLGRGDSQRIGPVTNLAHALLREHLRKAGDIRFPYLSLRVLGDEIAVDGFEPNTH